MLKATLNWLEKMKFSCENHGFTILVDAAKEAGGEDAGPTPKELVLNAMMGCTAMDVVSMLKKMRQEIGEFKMEIAAEKTTEHPIHFKSAELTYLLLGNIDPGKLIKAVESSLTKYCGVNYMISKTCPINYKIVLNGDVIKRGSVLFPETSSSSNYNIV